VDAVDKLRQIVADISVAMANASSQQNSQDGDSIAESRSCEYDNVTSLSTSSSQLDAPDGSADSETSANGGRFVSNTSVTLSSPALADAPPRTRTTMREMCESNGYVSYTSPKDLPACPPVRQPSRGAADVEKEWRQIVHVAETVVEGSPSVSHTSLERLGADSDHQRPVVFTVGDSRPNGLTTPQPLSFANPLFLYKSSSRPSGVGSATALDSILIQKSYSLTSVADDIGSQPTDGGRAMVTSHDDSPGRSVPSRQRIGASLKCRKPSQSNECLTDGMVREDPQIRHSAVVSSSGSSPKMLEVSSKLSQSTELAVICSVDQSKHSSTTSSVVGLDTPPDSPRCSGAGGYQKQPGSRKVTPSQHCVRMGVRSMQRRPIEPDKSKIEASVV